MVKFSDLRGGVNSRNGGPNSLRQAVLTPSIVAMIADGVVEDMELDQLRNLCAFNPLFKGVDLEELVNAVYEDVTRQGADAAIKAVASRLSPALCNTAICFAVRIAWVDRSVDAEELATLERSAELLSVQTEVLRYIQEVVAMMQYSEGA